MLADGGCKLIYSYDTQREHTGVTDLLDDSAARDCISRICFTTESSLEDIFVGLVRQQR